MVHTVFSANANGLGANRVLLGVEFYIIKGK